MLLTGKVNSWSRLSVLVITGRPGVLNNAPDIISCRRGHRRKLLPGRHPLNPARQSTCPPSQQNQQDTGKGNQQANHPVRLCRTNPNYFMLEESGRVGQQLIQARNHLLKRRVPGGGEGTMGQYTVGRNVKLQASRLLL
jgi:hypothetical protein